MLVYVQWAKANPADYVAYEIASMQDVRRLPRKGIPSSGSTIDNNEGWVNDLLIQGISFSGYDHISAAFPAAGVLRVIAWNDDPADFPEGPSAYVWDLADPAPDPRYGGTLNTRQTLTVYSDVPAVVARYTGQSASGGPVTVLPWSAFTVPAANTALHGIWLDDALYAQHMAARGHHGWREWVK